MLDINAPLVCRDLPNHNNNKDLALDTQLRGETFNNQQFYRFYDKGMNDECLRVYEQFYWFHSSLV